MNLQELIKSLKIKLVNVNKVDSSPSPAMDNMDHWKVTLFRRLPGDHKRQMTLTYSKGYGHQGKPPEAEEVLECLLSDSTSVMQSDFQEWAENLGYDTDSRKAEKIYNQCQSQAKELDRFLGEHFETALNLEQD